MSTNEVSLRENNMNASLPRALLERQMADGVLPSAYLFWGDDSKEKDATITWFLEKNFGERFAIHPDFFEVAPEEEPNGSISIAQIYELRRRAFSKPTGDRKIIVIREIHRLSHDAAPALLKILEEPPEHTMFLATTSRRNALLLTIRSRFISLRFYDTAQKKLKYLGEIEPLSYQKRFAKVPEIIEAGDLSELLREVMLKESQKLRGGKTIDASIERLSRLVVLGQALQNPTINKRLVGEYCMMLL